MATLRFFPLEITGAPIIICDVEPQTYYRQTSNISGTLVGNKIVDHSGVVQVEHTNTDWCAVTVAWWHQAINWTNVDLSSARSCGIQYIIIRRSKDTNQRYKTENCILKIASRFPRDQWVDAVKVMYMDMLHMDTLISTDLMQPNQQTITSGCKMSITESSSTQSHIVLIQRGRAVVTSTRHFEVTNFNI